MDSIQSLATWSLWVRRHGDCEKLAATSPPPHQTSLPGPLMKVAEATRLGFFGIDSFAYAEEGTITNENCGTLHSLCFSSPNKHGTLYGALVAGRSRQQSLCPLAWNHSRSTCWPLYQVLQIRAQALGFNARHRFVRGHQCRTSARVRSRRFSTSFSKAASGHVTMDEKRNEANKSV